MKIAIIGGGAAGFFAAIAAKENHPEANVVIYEKSQKILSKVKVSGGGRCNVTNGCTDIKELAKAYPRGSRAIERSFYEFNTTHTMQWFESRGVPLMIQEDNCVFPTSQNSQSIIDVFINETKRLDIAIVLGQTIGKISSIHDEKLEIQFKAVTYKPKIFDKVIVATGGASREKNLEWLSILGHKIATPLPSLFTFNMPDESIKNLMGIVVENTLVSIQGTKLKSDGPLLITHWGMSGPAILKLSSFGARILSEKDYNFKVQVNWVNEKNNELVLKELQSLFQENPNKIVGNIRPYFIPIRLWHFLLEKGGFSTTKKCIEIGKKGQNKMISLLTNDTYAVSGKTTFKEEFVTCGGISLDSVDFKTMQSKEVRNLYFAGEVLDIDGITGGYNFQAAWTTGFIAGKLK